MPNESKNERFQDVVLVHLDAAWRYARWIVRDDTAAEDALQDSCMKALRALDTRTGESARGWFMAIVRNTCLDILRARAGERLDSYDETERPIADAHESPEDLAVRSSDARWLRAQVASLPADYREAIVLREFEELSYREIAEATGVPIGTVMSRLARARDMLAERVRARRERERA